MIISVSDYLDFDSMSSGAVRGRHVVQWRYATQRTNVSRDGGVLIKQDSFVMYHSYDRERLLSNSVLCLALI